MKLTAKQANEILLRLSKKEYNGNWDLTNRIRGIRRRVEQAWKNYLEENYGNTKKRT